MKENEICMADRFGITERCKKLEQEILALPGATSVEYDLNGWLDNIHQVIILVGYNWKQCSSWQHLAVQVCQTAEQNALAISGDSIEDYGEHLYFVFDCKPEWMQSQKPAGTDKVYRLSFMGDDGDIERTNDVKYSTVRYALMAGATEIRLGVELDLYIYEDKPWRPRFSWFVPRKKVQEMLERKNGNIQRTVDTLMEEVQL